MSKRGILVIADGKSRYFCLFQFPEDADYWEPLEKTGDLGVWQKIGFISE